MLSKWLIGPNWFGGWDPTDLLSLSVPELRHGPALRLPWFSPGSAAIGGCFSAVLQAAGGLLMISEKGCLHLKNLKNQTANSGHQSSSISTSSSRARFPVFCIGDSTRHAAAFVFNRFASLFLSASATRDGLPAVSVAITCSSVIFPPSEDLKAGFLDTGLRIREEVESQEMIVEPRTGTRFPLHLYVPELEIDGGELRPIRQVLVGVGVRSKTIVKFKSIDIYAFGLSHLLTDVHPEQLRAQLGDKYLNVPPEELKFCPEFYEDLLRHEVDMTVRMVVHYKGLKMHMVRSAFESSLKNRLRKIKGVPDDSGLHTFCSYLSEDIAIFRGTTIDVQWQPGGQLRTSVEGRSLGTIVSHHLCRAFFDMYIGDPPISSKAKTEIGENFARLLGRRN